ncbi:MAG: orotidine-5'-phosphate decarboxylase [Hydrogenovibrio crunogenus]|uniref:Orotidine 5'-phosphate decarboxylase n=1 Tax=Hydrogenovibrio crunogenus (strain DSM 25203 / XCL-2) TaxID=317025 RepID=PYRF_HYDCU|nr:RecName: Full=Orotidine 5'-phosphate decarboxylase; AltName: Full=OMP decarboxylase; Short=OMPDCase; Short=OMPdecase [Hydrogenovibrio crunogenus XCL-2]MBD3612329.1 orotidine-5'-phosphate decarboxylase [Hydrogenovibrio crunogenus]
MNQSVQPDPKVVVALDFPKTQLAEDFARHLDPQLCRLKVGKELFALGGPQLVEKLITQGFEVFLDLKYHDIPNTVAMACRAAAEMGVWMVNVHSLGGRKMMEAAKEAVLSASHQPLLIGVTILTSMETEDLAEIGLTGTPKENVLRLAKLAHSSGLDGVVSSAQEASDLRKEIGQDFCLVTPGIRPANADVNDQKRIMTPADAMAAGSSYLVVGRPITQAKDPIAVLNEINASIGR